MWTSGGKFGSFWLHATVSGPQTHTAASTRVRATDEQNVAQTGRILNSSLRIRWHFPYERKKLPAISDMVFHESRKSSTELSPRSNGQNHSQVCVLIISLLSSAVLGISCPFRAVLPTSKQNLTERCSSCKQTSRKSRVAFYVLKVNIRWKTTQMVTAAILTRLSDKESDTAAPSGWKLCYLHL